MDQGIIGNAENMILICGMPYAEAFRDWKSDIKNCWEESGIYVDDAVFEECCAASQSGISRIMDNSSHDFQYLLGQRVNVALQHLCNMGKFDPADIEQYAASICLELIALSRKQIAKLLPQLGDSSSRMCVSLCADFYGDLLSVLKMLGMSEMFSSVYNRGDAQSGDRVIPYGLDRILSIHKVEKRGILIVGDLTSKRLDSVIGPEYRKCSLKDNATDPIAECLYSVCEIIALFGNK